MEEHFRPFAMGFAGMGKGNPLGPKRNKENSAQGFWDGESSYFLFH